MWNVYDKTNDQTKKKETIDTENRLMFARGKIDGLGNKGERINKYKFIVTKKLQGCKVRHREYRQ